MTAGYIEFHASQRPSVLAALYAGRAISFAETRRGLRALLRSVQELNLPRGGRIAVAAGDAYLHLVLLLAFERLGIATASLLPEDLARTWSILSSFDLVVTDEQSTVSGFKKHLVLTREWMGRHLDRPDSGAPLPPRPPENSPARVLRTSGTTSAAKWFQITRHAHDGMVHEWARQFQMTARSRILLTLPFTVRAMFEFVSAGLRAGGAVVFDRAEAWSSLISAGRVTHAIFLPTVLQGVLEGLPSDFRKPPELTILCFGAHLAPALRERALAQLATEVCDLYGTIEVGAVSTSWNAEDAGFAAICPTALAEIVDQNGAPAPQGTPGRIRVNTEYMSDGYLDDPETTRRMFVDGWFYPGDIGVLDGRSRLRVLGRSDDMLNIGGVKHLPARLEEMIRASVPLDDIGVSSLPGESGMEELWIGAASRTLGAAELATRIGAVLRANGVASARVRKLDAVPRNANGKIERGRLRDLLRATPQSMARLDP